MINFDKTIKEYAESLWWNYYRYSDDILMIIPFEQLSRFNESAKDKVISKIDTIKLKIQPEKTDIFTFQNGKLITSYGYFKENEEDGYFIEDLHLKPLQYLWFLFDWSKVLLRNKTLSIHNYRMHQTIGKHIGLIHKNKVKWEWGVKFRNLNKRFTHLWSKRHMKRYWNFYGYMLKANEIMSDFQQVIWAWKNRIKKQMRKYPKNYQQAIWRLKKANYEYLKTL